MSRTRLRGVVAAVAIPFLLAACDTVSGTFNALVGHRGAGNDASLTAADDDLRRPPLTLPPDYNLRPPSASSAGATDFTAAQQARQTVFGLDQDKTADAKAKASGGASSGEEALLKRAGVSTTAPDVRQTVDQESNKLKNQENTFTNNLLNPPADSAAGKSADGGWFSSIFGDSNKPTITH